MSDTKFIDGLIAKAPHGRAPDYVKARLSIRREELIGWLQQQTDDWINVDIKESQQGKWYASVDDWKPNQGGSRGGAPQRQRPANPPGDSGFKDDAPPF